jgi:hypothetical protein
MTAGVSITTAPAGFSAPYEVWFAVVPPELEVLGPLVIGPVLLFVADALLEAVFLSVADVADPVGFADPLPLELGADVRLADAVGDGESFGAADES